MGFGDWFSDSIASPIYHTSGAVKDAAGDAWNDVTGKTASRNAANAQVTASKNAEDVQKQMFDKTVELNEPWRQAGISALSDLSGGIKSGAFDYTPDTYKGPSDISSDYRPETFNFQEDPGYQYRLQQQQQAIQRSAAAQGGMFSGATLSDLAAKSGQMASDEYGAAFNRFNINRAFDYNASQDRLGQQVNNRNFGYGAFSDAQNAKRTAMNDRFSRLSSLAGLGENATARTGQANANYGDAMSGLITGAGNAQATGIVGGYNTQRDTLMGLANLGVKAGTAIAGGA